MIDNPFREWLAPRVDFLLEIYRRFGVTPNQLTLLAFAFAALCAAAVAMGWNWLAIGLWWLSRLLDGTDGIYARRIGKTSRFGAYFDIVCDMASYAIVVVGLAIQHSHLALLWTVIVALYVLCITSALAFGHLSAEAGLKEGDNRGLRLGAGLAEGGETGIAYTLFFLFPGAITPLAVIWTVVLMTTVVARTLLARRVL